jgi:hypothetical protein
MENIQRNPQEKYNNGMQFEKAIFFLLLIGSQSKRTFEEMNAGSQATGLPSMTAA